MGYEIEFLRVGDPGDDGKCCRSGDAIAIRWGNLSGGPDDQTVMVVDGGFNSSGEALVSHIKKYYKTSTIDYLVSSHPHDDHIKGMFPVIDGLTVGSLFMHKPWEHANAVVDLLNDNRHTYTGSKKRLKESFRCAVDLHNAAQRKGIQIIEPFEGVRARDGSFHFLGPGVEFYQQLIAADASGQDVSDTVKPVSRLSMALSAFVRKVTESWDKDNLAEPSVDAVQPLNHTSTIIHLNVGEITALLTADAGVAALERAATYAERVGIDLKQCARVQVPHHGSKRNVGPKILDRILGPILPPGTEGEKTGMLSAAQDGAPKHPSVRVTNAFRRRGAAVSGSQGQTIRWSSADAPDRGWTRIPPIPFMDTYDEDEE
jgi:beta-lactamase superfamily II metal-dependent hydrolase